MKFSKGRCFKHMHGHFGECGLRMTASREAILHVLSTMKEHASAEDVYMAAHKLTPRIGLTTVYRTLEILCQMGMVYKINFADGRSRYELSETAGGHEHHHHIVCVKCGKIINYNDFSEKEVQVICDLQGELEKKYDISIKHHSVQYYGECGKCRRKEKEA